jgi:DNA-3-methyladenine glycosylase
MSKLNKSFYQNSAVVLAPQFLGKYLVFNSPNGKVSGMIVDVEAYPANDFVSHGRVRTKRTEVMYQEGGFGFI